MFFERLNKLEHAYSLMETFLIEEKNGCCTGAGGELPKQCSRIIEGEWDLRPSRAWKVQLPQGINLGGYDSESFLDILIISIF